MKQHPKLALLAEDCPVLSWVLEFYLQEQNWRVVVASCVEDTLSLCSKHSPDLVFLNCRYRDCKQDIYMANQIRYTFQIPVVLITANEPHFIQLQSDFYPACEVLYKPFTRRKFRQILETQIC